MKLTMNQTNWVRTAVMAAGCALAMESAVQAIPSLQLDIAGGAYDPVGQNVVQNTPGKVIDLYALLIPNDTNPLNDTYYLSIAVTPKLASTSTTPLGSIIINGGTPISVPSGFTYGIPPVNRDDALNKNLEHPDYFPTFYKEISFQFSSANKAAQYNVQDDPGGIDLTGTGLYYNKWTIDYSGLNAGYELHFDLYNVDSQYRVTSKAPYSHDAETRRVPDAGSTLSLLGCALLGIEGLRRKLSLKA
jgi:hypothetical protein